MRPNEIKNMIIEYNENALFLDGMDGDTEAFNEALIGCGERHGISKVAAYNASSVINILITKYDMSHEEAIEWYEINIIGAYMGEDTPIFIDDFREF